MITVWNMLSIRMSWKSHCWLVFFKFPLQGELDRERFTSDLKRIVEMDTGYKAELRIFVSKGERYFLCDYGRQCPFKSTCDSTICTCLTRFARVRLLWTFYPWAKPRPRPHGDSWLADNTGCGARTHQSSGWDERCSLTGGFMFTIINLHQKWVEFTNLWRLLSSCHPNPSVFWLIIHFIYHFIDETTVVRQTFYFYQSSIKQ